VEGDVPQQDGLNNMPHFSHVELEGWQSTQAQSWKRQKYTCAPRLRNSALEALRYQTTTVTLSGVPRSASYLFQFFSGRLLLREGSTRDRDDKSDDARKSKSHCRKTRGNEVTSPYAPLLLVVKPPRRMIKRSRPLQAKTSFVIGQKTTENVTML